MAKYPHMLPNELRIWDRFIQVMGDRWERFEYDVHVGEGVDPGPGYPEKWRKLAIMLTQKRIDAVGYAEDGIWIFEVKPDAGLSALGQLLGYKVLFERDRKPSEPIHLAVVTNRVFPDEKFIFDSYGVRVFVVEGV